MAQIFKHISALTGVWKRKVEIHWFVTAVFVLMWILHSWQTFEFELHINQSPARIEQLATPFSPPSPNVIDNNVDSSTQRHLQHLIMHTLKCQVDRPKINGSMAKKYTQSEHDGSWIGARVLAPHSSHPRQKINMAHHFRNLSDRSHRVVSFTEVHYDRN